METAITHYEALKTFLATHLAREQTNGSRTNAREKLTRLSQQQFQELSTDVYDELTRRLLDSNEVPFLPVRDEFHPKRNQARQKLATLPKNRFKDLASDVYYELERRYPELLDIDFSSTQQQQQQQYQHQQQHQQHQHQQHQQHQQQQHQQQQQYTTSPPSTPSYNNNATSNNTSQRKIIEGTTSGYTPKSNTIVPEMSTLRQETISIDYLIQKPNNRPPDPSSVNNNNNNNVYSQPSLPDGKPPEYGSPKSPRSRTQSTTSSVSDFGRRYNNMSMSSVSSGDSRNRDTSTSHVSQKSVGKPDTVNFASLDSLMADLGDMIDKRQNDNSSRSHTPSSSGQITLNSDIERLRSEFESRITALQKRIKELESELSSKGGNSVADNVRIQELERQLKEQQEINKEQRSNFEKLNEDHKQQQEVANDVQKEASTLLEEIKLLSMQNDDLYSEKEQDSAKIKTLTVEVNEWKSKYEKVKIELRNLKATSSFFKETPKIDVIKDNSLAPTPDGAIDESKIIAYQISIDDLLRAGRSDVPANVLMAMKSIVIACKSITEEVDIYEQRKTSIMKTEDKDKLYSLKTKLSATLTNLMTAAKNHATGYGISPVSLLDAAASHLTASVVDLVKLVKLRRSNSDSNNRLDIPLPSNKPLSTSSSSSSTLDSSYFTTNNTPLTSPAAIDNKTSENLTDSPRSNTIIENTDGRNGVDIDELKDFLERQTESIVQAIQTLLAAIRNQSHGNELTDNINTITTIVLNVIAVCQDSFNSPIGTPYRTRGDTILKELGNSIDKLDEMRETISNNSEDFLSNKLSKQRLASASFEIAKFTKELVGLIE